MNFLSHLSFGVFTGLLAYYVTNDWIVSLLVLLIQIGLILDFLFKKVINSEPLHSVLAMISVWIFSFFLFPAYHLWILFAYFTHLCLDIFVHEEIPLLFPFKKQLMFPIKNSERIVMILSVIGSIIVLVMILI